VNFKNKYEKILTDYYQVQILNKNLENRTNELLMDSKESIKLISDLSNENRCLKSKQSIFDGFKEEASNYIEIIKEDSSKKNESIVKLENENSE